jgi:hypothetical protein
MKSYCLKDHISGQVFKVFVTEEKLKQYLEENPLIAECVDCIECDDSPSILIE